MRKQTISQSCKHKETTANTSLRVYRMADWENAKYGLLKKLFASFQQLEWKNSDRNQSSILVILTYAKYSCTQEPFQHEIKLSSSFTSSLGSCRLLMIVSLLISKSSSKLWQKRQYVSTFLLVNNVSSFYQTISSLDMDLSQKIYKEFLLFMRIQYRSLVRPSTSSTGPLKKNQDLNVFMEIFLCKLQSRRLCLDKINNLSFGFVILSSNFKIFRRKEPSQILYFDGLL